MKKPKTKKPVLAWHFLADTGLLRDGKKPPADGKVLVHRGTLKLCERGLHASVRAIDALEFAPGAVICRVECSGKILHEKDKLVCTRRKILWRYDATKVLRAFARKQALSVAHLWKMPKVVRDYLEAAAWAAARDAAWDAAGDAARVAANTMLEQMLTEGRPVAKRRAREEGAK